MNLAFLLYRKLRFPMTLFKGYGIMSERAFENVVLTQRATKLKGVDIYG